MESALAQLRLVTVWWVAVLLMVSLWLHHTARIAADRYLSAATAAVSGVLATHALPPPNSAGECPHAPSRLAWSQPPGPGAPPADVAAWEAASVADSVIARRITDNPSHWAEPDPNVTGRAGFVSISPLSGAESCEVVVRLRVRPLRSRFAFHAATALGCVDLADTTGRGRCAIDDLAP